MKVIPKESAVCNGCDTRDSYIYFTGPGGSRRECMVCSNEQAGIDMRPDDNCNRCGCLLTWKYNADGVKLCGECNRRDKEYRDDMLRDAIGDDEYYKLVYPSKEELDSYKNELFDLDGVIPMDEETACECNTPPCAKSCAKSSGLCKECQIRWDCSQRCRYDFTSWFNENKYKAHLITDDRVAHHDTEAMLAQQFDESDLSELVYDYGTDWVEEHYGVDLSVDSIPF